MTEPGPLRPDAVVAAGGLVTAWGVLIWLGVTSLLLVVGTLPGHTGRLAAACAERVTPAVLTRLARYALGLTLATGSTVGIAGPAQAGVPAGAPDPVPEAAVGPTLSLDRPAARNLERPHAVHRHGRRSLPTPTPTGVATPVPIGTGAESPSRVATTIGTGTETGTRTGTTRTGNRTAPSTAVVVRRGDTLWAIAARHLPADAPAIRVAAEWPRWYRVNVDVVGGDPDLIRPGQRLRPALNEETR